MSKKLIIFGTEKLAQLAYFYFTKDSPYEVVAYTIDEKFITEKKINGLPVVPFEKVELVYSPKKYMMFVAVGYKKLNKIRAEKYNQSKRKGYRLVSYVSSKSIKWGDTKIGDNCFILENQVIQTSVEIGNNVVIWSGNHFGHDVVIEDNCWISSHIVVSGGVKIGQYSFIGVNATIRDDVYIGKECIIGAGTLILRNTKDKEVYVASQTPLYRLDSTYFEKLMDISG